MRITTLTHDGMRVSYRPEDVLMDLQHQVMDGEITHERAIVLAKLAVSCLTLDDLDEWFPHR
jgi:hypothetical protein